MEFIFFLAIRLTPTITLTSRFNPSFDPHPNPNLEADPNTNPHPNPNPDLQVLTYGFLKGNSEMRSDTRLASYGYYTDPYGLAVQDLNKVRVRV